MLLKFPCKNIILEVRECGALTSKQLFEKVNGLNVRYLEGANDLARGLTGVTSMDGKRHHVLFIHGLGSSADRWLDIPDALSLYDMHTVALDLPGFGMSDKPDNFDYTINKFVQVVVDFMVKLGMADGTTSIVGHSLGGYIAAQLAAEHRNLIEKLILIDSSGMLNGPTALLQQYLDAAMNPSKDAVRCVFEQLVADPIRIPEALVDGFIYRISQPGAKHAFKLAFDNSVYSQLGISRLKQIDDAKIPTLIVWGKQDKLIPLENVRTFQEAITHSNVVIVGDAGHAPFAEKPAIVCELLHKFLTPK
jgi:2-hydroxy-6-oxonona-2,4-dienedioate hydrolase